MCFFPVSACSLSSWCPAYGQQNLTYFRTWGPIKLLWNKIEERDVYVNYNTVISVQKVLSGSGSAGRLRLMGKYIGHRLVARPDPVKTFWTDRTSWKASSFQYAVLHSLLMVLNRLKCWYNENWAKATKISLFFFPFFKLYELRNQFKHSEVNRFESSSFFLIHIGKFLTLIKFSKESVDGLSAPISV